MTHSPLIALAQAKLDEVQRYSAAAKQAMTEFDEIVADLVTAGVLRSDEPFFPSTAPAKKRVIQ